MSVDIEAESTKRLHDSMREMAQEIWDAHGVCVISVKFSWTDISHVGATNLLLADVEIETLTKS